MSAAARVRWWRSGYDEKWHAFPAEQADDPDANFLSAMCDHSVPVEQVERIPAPHITALCPACLGKLADPERKADPNELWRGL